MTTTPETMTTTTPSPIENNQSQVLVRNTVTGFEQGIAAAAGLFTAGPLGAVASWATIRGVQGKWTPWFVLGVPASAVINVINFTVLAALLSLVPVSETDYESESGSLYNKIEHVMPID